VTGVPDMDTAERAGYGGPPLPRPVELPLARLRDLALVPVILVLLVVGAFSDSSFLTVENQVNVLQQSSELGLLVLAEMLILVAGRFDLSLESTVGLAPALGILSLPVLHRLHLPDIAAILVCTLAGALIGAINGAVIVWFRLSAFVLTLGMLITLRGLQLGLTGGKSLFTFPASFGYLGSTQWGIVPISVVLLVVAYAVGIAVLGFMRYGRALYAIGGNVDAARAAGIRTDWVIWSVFVIGGILAAIAGLLLVGRLGSVAANQGQGMIFQVFAAAVIGGVSLDGGKGTLFGALCGVLVLGLIQNILLHYGVSAQWNQAIYGVIIILALVLARLTTGKAQD
jgi:simple sugar transport system permease protein/ribose transport system permease protein